MKKYLIGILIFSATFFGVINFVKADSYNGPSCALRGTCKELTLFYKFELDENLKSIYNLALFGDSSKTLFFKAYNGEETLLNWSHASVDIVALDKNKKIEDFIKLINEDSTYAVAVKSIIPIETENIPQIPLGLQINLPSSLDITHEFNSSQGYNSVYVPVVNPLSARVFDFKVVEEGGKLKAKLIKETFRFDDGTEKEKSYSQNEIVSETTTNKIATETIATETTKILEKKSIFVRLWDSILKIFIKLFHRNQTNINNVELEPQITVISPNGGEIWSSGSRKLKIQWSATGVGNINIYFISYPDGKKCYFASRPANEGEYIFDLNRDTPCLYVEFNGHIDSGKVYKMFIYGDNWEKTGLKDESDDYFLITPDLRG